MSHQRWHEWRNADPTTCPAFGLVQVVVPIYNEPDGQVPNGGTVAKAPLVVDDPRSTSFNEIFGTTFILHGKRPQYNTNADNEYLANTQRGIIPYFAFNGETSVEPGEMGLLTFDLPTWAVIGGIVERVEYDQIQFTPGDGIWTFGTLVTGIDDWVMASVRSAGDLFGSTGCLYTLGADEPAKRVFVGAGVIYAIGGDPQQ